VEGVHEEPIYPGNGSRSASGVDKGSTDQETIDDELFRRSSKSNKRGTEDSTQQGSDSKRPRGAQYGSVFTNICDSEEVRRLACYTGSTVPKFLCREEKIQDGRNIYGFGDGGKGLLFYQNRRVRCLFPSGNRSQPPKISQIRVRGSNLSLRSHALRYHLRTPQIYQINQGSGKGGTGGGYKDRALYRRYPYHILRREEGKGGVQQSVGTVRRVGLQVKLGEINWDAKKDCRVSRMDYEFKRDEDNSTYGKSQESQDQAEKSIAGKLQSKGVGISTRSTPIFQARSGADGSAMSSSKSHTSGNAQDRQLSIEDRRYRGSKRGHYLVDRAIRGLEWKRHHSSQGRHDIDYGRVRLRMGCRTGRRKPYMGELETRREGPTHQSEGIGGSKERIGETLFGQEGLCNTGAIRQHGDSVVYKSPRRQNDGFERYRKVNVGLGSREGNFSSSNPYSRVIESSRRAVTQKGPGRLGVRRLGVQKVRRKVGTSYLGSICRSHKPEDTKIRVLELRPRSLGHGCVKLPMAKRRESIRASTIHPYRKGSEALARGRTGDDSSGAGMEYGPVVPRTTGHVKRGTHSNTLAGPPNKGGTIGELSMEGQQVESSRLPPVAKELRGRGYSRQAIDLITRGVRKSTAKHYLSSWKKWELFAKKKKFSATNPPTASLINYLVKLFRAGRSPSTVNLHRSAISTISNMVNPEIKPGDNPVVSRMMKGMWEIKPQKAKYKEFWDPELILALLRKWGENSSMPLEKLTKKCIILLKLAIFGRTSDLKGIRRSLIKFRENSVSLEIYGSKENRSNANPTSPPIFLACYEDVEICPVKCLETYLERTGERTDGDFLFVEPRGNIRKLGKREIDKIVLEIMKEAGINTSIFKSHSVRGAAATKALEKGMPLEDVLLTGRWSSVSVFKKFYARSHRPLQSVQHLSSN
jgi:site-specific recombinase XerD